MQIEPNMAQDSSKVEAHDTTEASATNVESKSTEDVIVMKPKFYYIKKLFMPWKWKKKKKSDKFNAISNVLERKMSTRLSKDQLIVMGLIPQEDTLNPDKENPCFDEDLELRQESVSMFVKNMHEESSMQEREVDRSWVSEIGVIPPPDMFSPSSSKDPRLASRVTIMGVGEGLDLSDASLCEKIEQLSQEQDINISDNLNLPVEAINKEAIVQNNFTNKRKPKLVDVVKLAIEEDKNKLVLEVNNQNSDSGRKSNDINENVKNDDCDDERSQNVSIVSATKRKLSEISEGSNPAPRPPLKEKPSNLNSPKTLEEWQERRERIGKNLERRLSSRPSAEELKERNLIPKMSKDEKEEIKRRISIKLERRLSIRPTETDLKNRNILRQETSEESKQKQEETKNILQRKLSIRPSVAELQKRKILKFSEYIEVSIFYKQFCHE